MKQVEWVGMPLCEKGGLDQVGARKTFEATAESDGDGLKE